MNKCILVIALATFSIFCATHAMKIQINNSNYRVTLDHPNTVTTALGVAAGLCAIHEKPYLAGTLCGTGLVVASIFSPSPWTMALPIGSYAAVRSLGNGFKERAEKKKKYPISFIQAAGYAAATGFIAWKLSQQS